MTKRVRPSTPSKGMQVAILFSRYAILCCECGERIVKPKDAEWDHRVEHADGGEHTVENIGPVHDKASGGCHKRKSATKETQRHHIERLEQARPVAVEPGELIYAKRVFDKPKRNWPSRQFPKRIAMERR